MTLKQLRQALEDDTGPLTDDHAAFLRRVWDILYPRADRVHVSGAGPSLYSKEEIEARLRANALAWAKDNAPDEEGAGWMDICPGSDSEKTKSGD